MLDSIDKVLDYAIQKEQDAADLYTMLAGKVEQKHMKQIFEEFALEEVGHKAKLERIKAGEMEFSPPSQQITDLKIGDTLKETPIDGDIDYQQALILAMKAEKAAFKLYTDLAAMADDANIKQVFQGLAQEEAKHKLRFEIEYDENILMEN
jgi:rubrerythrin